MPAGRVISVIADDGHASLALLVLLRPAPSRADPIDTPVAILVLRLTA